MSQAVKATYVGKIADLKGKTALVRPDGAVAYAQFDDAELTDRRRKLGVGWHEFAMSDFKVDEVAQ